jgi:uncharacterized glyoxalase superfamily protein PhnB
MLPGTVMAKRKAAPKKRREKKALKRPRVAPAPQPAAGSGLAPGMQTVNSYLAVANVAATMEFLERAFGFVRGVVLPDAAGRFRYAEMRHGDSVVMLIPKGDATSASDGAAALYTYVHDVDRALAQARAAGAEVGEAQDKPWGDRVVTVTDPDGYRWVLATFKKLAPFS